MTPEPINNCAGNPTYVLEKLHDEGIDGRDNDIILVDSGIIKGDLPFDDKIVGDRTPVESKSGELTVHSTLVASIIHRIVPKSMMKDIAVCSSSSPSEHEKLSSALPNCKRYALEKKKENEGVPAIVNMSIGTSDIRHCSGSCEICKRVDSLTEDGDALVVVSAGNNGDNIYNDGKCCLTCPANARKPLVVGEGNLDGVKTHSGGGPTIDNRMKPDLITQSDFSWMNDFLFEIFDEEIEFSITKSPLKGTSLSTPVIVGISSLLSQLHPNWGYDDIKNFFYQSSQKIDGVPEYRQGSGVFLWECLLEEAEDVLGKSL